MGLRKWDLTLMSVTVCDHLRVSEPFTRHAHPQSTHPQERRIPLRSQDRWLASYYRLRSKPVNVIINKSTACVIWGTASM